MNLIQEIRKDIGDICTPFKISFWSDEMTVYIGDDEIPISVFPFQESTFDNIIIDTEGFEWKLRGFQILQLGKIMESLQEHMDEIRTYFDK